MFNLLGSCTTYDVDLSKVSDAVRQDINDNWNALDADCMQITMSEDDISQFHIPAGAIDYDSYEFDEYLLEDILTTAIGRYPYYLIFGEHMTWNNQSGYKFVTNILDTCRRNYEFSLYQISEAQDKAMVCMETTHDKPTGFRTIIIGVTDVEYKKLKDASFDEIEKFAKVFDD